MAFKKGDLVKWREDNSIAIVLGRGEKKEETRVSWLFDTDGSLDVGEIAEPLTKNLVLVARAKT